MNPATSGHTGGPTLGRRAFLTGAAAGGAALVVASIGLPPAAATSGPATAQTLPGTTATDWVRTLYGVVMAEGLTPPAAARFYHYTAVTMYETGRRPNHRPLAGQLERLAPLPEPHHRVERTVVMHEAVAAVAVGLLPQAAASSVEAIAAHRDASIGARTDLRPVLVERSRRHGRRIAARLLKWMATDGAAEAAALGYAPPVGPELWRSTPPNFGTAIDPYWSMVRPAILHTADEVEPAAPVPFSTEPGSPFHEQAMAPYLQSSANTEDQKAIARFWTDNPRLSGLPSGHWFLLLASLADGPLGLDFDRSLEAMARLGVALHDAFLNCWTWKYRYNLIRPVSYIHDHIDPEWVTLVNTPQFPEYTSGHSVASGAAEVVLTSLFGSFAFTDDTGEARGLAGRRFTSFGHAADEAARSRLYGGIHYPMAIDNGLDQGRAIGRLVDRRLRTGPGRR